MIIETNSKEETYNFGKELGSKARPGEIYCLSGDLGAGKTLFSKGFAAGLDISEDVTSPTFTIICEYEDGTYPLYHFDVYRLSDYSELEELGVEDYFYGDGVCLVEWAENVKEIIPDNAKWIRIEKDISSGENYRRIILDFEC